MSLGSSHSILHKELGRSKRCARWVPHMLTEGQCQECVRISKLWLQMFPENEPRRISDVVTGDECWISFFTNKDKSSNMAWLAEDDPRAEVLKTGFRSRKRMFTIFFNTQGVVAVDILQDKATISAKYCTEDVLPQVLQSRAEQARTRSGSRLLLHHDNASAHTAATTVSFMKDAGVQLLPHSLYSPDLAPCDFRLFPKVKKAISGRLFSRIQDLARAVHSELKSIPPSSTLNASKVGR